MNRLAKASIVTLVLLVSTVSLGSLTRAYEAGLACGEDWPLCRGEVFPRIAALEVALEYFHRVLAGLSSIMVAYTAYLSTRPSNSNYPVKYLALATLAVLLIQVAVGMLTVKFTLAPAFSALHNILAVATIALASATATAAALQDYGPEPRSSRVRPVAESSRSP